jgi:hypothetical protein
MNSLPTSTHFGFKHPTLADSGAIEWEELPSLADSLSQRMGYLGAWARQATHTPGPGFAAPTRPWDATLPAELDGEVVSEPFRETLKGLATREVSEPDVFRHFFGALFLGR